MVEHWDVIQDARKFRRRSQLAKVLCYNFGRHALSVTPGRTIHSLPATLDDNFYSHPDYHTLEPTPAVH